MRHYWVATAALTGDVLADLPKLDVSRVKKIIGRYEPAVATFPLVGAPVDWERILTPYATMFWLMRENPSDPAHGIPLWGGLLTEDPLSEADVVELPLVTAEGYLDRRYVGNRTYTGVGQNLIVKDLVESFAAAGPNGGLPIRVQIVNGGDGKPRDREYKDQDDKTLYSVLQDLSGVIDGPEWSMGGEWQGERITPVLYVGDRIGTPKRADLAPPAVFDMPGCVTSFHRYRSYANGKGANVVMATSSGQGDDRPQSAPVITPDPLRPTVEERFTPSTSIKNTATLDEHAQARAALLADGVRALELSAAEPRAPRLDVDWSIGDDIGFDITAPAFPGGFVGVARAIGWELSPQGSATITPILAGGDLEEA